MRKPAATKRAIDQRMKMGQFFFLEDGTCMTYSINKTFEKHTGYPKTKKPNLRNSKQRVRSL